VALDEPVPVALDELVPVALDEPVPVALDELVPVALDEPVPVIDAEPVPVSVPVKDTLPVPVALLEPVPVALSLAVCEGDCVLVPVTEGTSTTASDTVSEAAKSTGLTPVVALYASKKPDVDSESSSGDEPPSSSLDCTLLSAVTRAEAVSCCTPVTSLMLAPVPATAGITMRMNTPLSACRRRALPALSLRPPPSSASASWNQMARPGPSSASVVTHCSLCIGYGDAAEAGSACKRRLESHEPVPPLSVSLKNTVLPAASVVLLSCTCSSGRPMEHASPERSECASAGDAANMRASGMGMAMPNSTAAGSMTAALPLALGDAVAVPVADAPAVVLAVGLSVSAAEPDAVVEGDPVGDRVRAGVRVSDVEGVPVCEGDAVPVVLAVTEADGVWLPVGLSLPVVDGDTPTDIL
jgi:hypothetical protein